LISSLPSVPCRSTSIWLARFFNSSCTGPQTTFANEDVAGPSAIPVISTIAERILHKDNLRRPPVWTSCSCVSACFRQAGDIGRTGIAAIGPSAHFGAETGAPTARLPARPCAAPPGILRTIFSGCTLATALAIRSPRSLISIFGPLNSGNEIEFGESLSAAPAAWAAPGARRGGRRGRLSSQRSDQALRLLRRDFSLLCSICRTRSTLSSIGSFSFRFSSPPSGVIACNSGSKISQRRCGLFRV